MVSSVASAPYYSYLSQLQAQPPQAAQPAATTPPTTLVNPTENASKTSASSLVSSLLGGGTGGFSSEVLSLLQQNGAGGFDPVSSLLGGSSANNALTQLNANLYTASAASALAQAQTGGAAQKAQSHPAASPIDGLLNALAQASKAYNQTALQTAQAVLTANSYGPDGVTPLVA